jgi:hypothetical protein
MALIEDDELLEDDSIGTDMQDSMTAEIPDVEVEPADEQSEDAEDTEVRGKSGYPTDIEDAIVTLNDYFAKEDESVRWQMLAFWKKLENYFSGLQRIFWNYEAEEWGRVESSEIDPTQYDKIINIYRAHGEAIIAALSIKLPHVNFYPDDADVTEDIDTAKAYSKVSELVSKHNQGILLFIKALFILFNQGVVAAYIYNRSKSEYGEIDVPDYGEDINVKTHTLSCPVCRGFISQSQEKAPINAPAPTVPTEPQGNVPGSFMQSQPGMGEEAPIAPEGAPPADINALGGGNEIGMAGPEPATVPCPNCGAEVEPEDDIVEETIPQIVGYNKHPKSRVTIDVFGPMYAQMPFYARNQEAMPYIRLRFEQHISVLQSIYANLEDEIPTGTDSQSFDREIRAYNNLEDAYSTNLVTTTCAWFRPWSFKVLNDKELVEKMKSYFPDGVYAVILKDVVAEAHNESLDEHWEISKNPLSNFIHADPLGKPLAPLQEIRNEINDLALETFEHSIPETFADPDVLDFDKYEQSQARPGMKYPAKKPMGGTISESFYTDKPASMSDEMTEYRKAIDLDAQFVTGSFPSIYGGPATGGSKTAKEYSESRAMALQRLNTTWTMLKYWWAGIMSKAVPLYVDAMSGDEKFVKKTGNTNFVNVWIKQQELTGKVGNVEPEIDEELPQSFAQYKAVLMEILTLNNDQLNSAIFNPQNAPNVTKALGWPEFHIPGADDRDKQFSEIARLLNMEQIEPEIGIDDDAVHAQIIRSWAVSSTGIATKVQNPEGYSNVVAHGLKHIQNMQTMMQDDSLSPSGEPSPSNAASVVE